MPWHREARSAALGRGLLALAGGSVLVALAVQALLDIVDAWRAAAFARALLEGYQGDGSPLSRGELGGPALIISCLCGGGLVVSGVYGARVCWLALRQLTSSPARPPTP